MAGRGDNVVNFRTPGRRPSRFGGGHYRRSGPSSRQFTAMLVALPLAAFGAVFFVGLPDASAFSFGVESEDKEQARFVLCGDVTGEGAGGSGGDRNCVIDGDTFWYRGEKVRIADINAPEAHQPQCHAERRLAARATGRLYDLLNAGPFTLEPNDDGTGRDRDSYGRLLRTVTRDGKSLGRRMVRAGLAEEWDGVRGSWC